MEGCAERARAGCGVYEGERPAALGDGEDGCLHEVEEGSLREVAELRVEQEGVLDGEVRNLFALALEQPVHGLEADHGLEGSLEFHMKEICEVHDAQEVLVTSVLKVCPTPVGF